MFHSVVCVFVTLSLAGVRGEEGSEPTAEPTAITPEELFRSAHSAISEGSFSDAQDLATQLIELDPNNSGYYSLRGEIRFRRHHYARAITDLDKALSLDPKNVEALLTLSKSHQYIGNFHKARENFERLLAVTPGDEEVQSALSTLDTCEYAEEKVSKMVEDGKCDAHVINLLTTVLQNSKYHPKMLFARASCAFEMKDYHSTLLDTSSILISNRNHLDSYHLRGQAYFHLDQLDVALSHYKQGLRLDPEHKALKKAYKELKKLDKLITQGDEFVEKRKNTEALERYTDALKIAKSQLKLASRLHLKECQVLVKLKRGMEAIRACSAALKIDPEMVDAYGERGDAKILEEMYEEAVQDWTKAASMARHDGRIQNGLKNAEKRLKMSKRKDYYKILDTPKSSTPSEIKKAFKKMALKWHPDKWKTEEEKEAAEKKFHDVNEAHEILSDPELKRRYDNGEDVLDQRSGGFPGGFRGGFPEGFFGGGGQGGFTFTFKTGR